MRSRARSIRLLSRLVAVLAFVSLATAEVPLTAPLPALAAPPDAALCQQGFLGSEMPRMVPECATDGEGAAAATAIADGFQETTIWSGLTNPTALRFAADGRVFVAEKSGRIKIFDSLSDPTPTTFSSLTTSVHNYWDRGLLGLALDPSLTGGTGTGSYVYVLYSYDHILGSPDPAPRWTDMCPNPPGSQTDGCVISGRLSRFAVTGSSITGSEQVLVEDWCQQFPSHTIGSIVFGADGALYVSAGDGANFNGVDYGQRGGTTDPVVTEKNPCGDPPDDAMTPPTAEGGALRSQDMRTTGDPAGLDGAILRLNPATGAGMPGNPFAGSGDANARRIIAYGFRNPFRITPRPGTSELWVGDVGWNSWEEINRIPNAADATAEDFGWPCYEGAGHQGSYDAANLDVCEDLYDAGTASAPSFTYHHDNQVVPGEGCPTVNGSSITGMAFYPDAGGSFPAAYEGGLFFADHSRNCIWFMPEGGNGQPDPTARATFVDGAANPVDLVIGPDGDLFYVDFDGGSIRRVLPNDGPTAVLEANPTFGPTPLTVDFDGSDSTDPEGLPLTYEWDLDGDGLYDDATGPTAQRTYSDPVDLTVGLRVTDNGLEIDTAGQVIAVGNQPPVPVIATPSAGLTWTVGDQISFSGSATDPQDGALPASALSWSLIQQHCSTGCHSHEVQTWSGTAADSFDAPDHGYPSYLELTLTATDNRGMQASVTRRLDPKTVVLTFHASAGGLQLAVNGSTSTAPFTRTVIVGSSNSVSATSPQTTGGWTYAYSSWSDGLGQSHLIVAPATNTTYTAAFGATGLSIPVSRDAQVRKNRPTTNYGTSATLRVRPSRSRVYLKFVVDGLSAPPTAAKIRLWVTDPSTNGGRVYRVSKKWHEIDITWSNAPSITSSPLAYVAPAPGGSWVEFNVTSAITGNGTFAFAIAGGTSGNAVDYASRETSHDPVLVLIP